MTDVAEIETVTLGVGLAMWFRKRTQMSAPIAAPKVRVTTKPPNRMNERTLGQRQQGRRR
jgi:hypothetical protein